MATKIGAKDGDIEAGNNGGSELYPNMTEDPILRWGFIRKVYAILSLQLLLTVGVAATIMFVRPIPRFMFQTTPGIVVFLVILILPFIRKTLFHLFRSILKIYFLFYVILSEVFGSESKVIILSQYLFFT